MSVDMVLGTFLIDFRNLNFCIRWSLQNVIVKILKLFGFPEFDEVCLAAEEIVT